MWKEIIVFLCLALSPIWTYSQGTNFAFETLPSEIGWTDNSVNDILQDHRGFLWVATWSGLKRYDGYTVKTYKQEPGDFKGLKSNKITCLFEDSRQRLWIGTNYTGFYQYIPETDEFIQYVNDPENVNSLSNNNVWTIGEDKSGMLWIGTENGLNRFDFATKNFLHFQRSETDERTLSHNYINKVIPAADGGLWVGSEVGLNRLIKGKNGNKDYFIRYDLAPTNVQDDNYLRHNFVYKIVISKYQPNTLWIATTIGLKKVQFFEDDLSMVKVENYADHSNQQNSISHPFVADILEDDYEQRLWIATYDGLNVLDINNGNILQFFPNPNDRNSITHNVVRALFIDRSGVLWIGTEKGMNNLNLKAKPFRNIHSFNEENNNIVSCIIPSKDRSGFWIGTHGAGLSFLPLKDDKPDETGILHYPLTTPLYSEFSNFITNMIVDEDGMLWIATNGGGVIRIKEADIPADGKQIKALQQFTKEDVLEDDYVMSFLESKNGDIWIGYWDKGLGQYEKATNSFKHYSSTSDLSLNLKEFPLVHLMEIEQDGQQYIWVGTRGGGVVKMRFDQEEQKLDLVKRYKYENGEERGLSNSFINSFLLESNEQLWIGTENGLNLLDLKTERFKYFLEKDGLANSVIQSVLSDENSNIWVSTINGISCLNVNENELSVKNFDANDGLQDNFFYDESAAKSASGYLMFGGAEGLNYFLPEDIKVDSTPPKVVITDFRLFNNSVSVGPLGNGRTILNKTISETKDLTLTHQDHVLAFEFVGLQFGEPQKIKYAHKLEGFNEDWIFTDADERIAHYTNLPYKDFKFMVRAANGDGVWSEPVELKLTITPPFWLTTSAFVLYALLVIGLVYGVIRIVKVRAELRHRLALEKIERDKLEEVNKMKLQFFTNISHELRTPLTLLISPLEQYVKEKAFGKKVHKSMIRMYNNANRLLIMINQLLDIRKSESGLMHFKVAEGNITKFVKEVILSFKGIANRQGVDITFLSKEKKIIAWYDRDQMEKVLFNLLSNALKFTPGPGQIEVQLYYDSDKENHFVLAVKDTGVGISSEQIPYIFDRFYQAEIEDDLVSQKRGTGIGLALTKNIIKAHHGEIEVESEKGKGATFKIRLPLGEAHYSEKEKIRDFKNSEELTNYFLTDVSEDEVHFEHAEVASVDPSTATNNPKILIVEDNADIRNYLKENLEASHEILEAANGEEGWKSAEKELPELIIADISMPVMDGIELCRKIKTNISTSHIPVVLLTARTSLIFKINGLETGADDYVTKPFNMNLLRTRIKNLIDSRLRLREKFAKNFDLSPSGVVMNSLDEDLLTNIKSIVEKNLGNSDFSVELLAKSVHMSRIQLYRKLKALTGESPNKIIRTIRLKRAAQLLKTKQYNVSDVTYMVGYNDLKSFRDQFKKEYGVSPSAYS